MGLDPIPCTFPHCREPSVFSTRGMVAGRYEPRCLGHAINDAACLHEVAGVYLDALRALNPATELPGQLRLVEG